MFRKYFLFDWISFDICSVDHNYFTNKTNISSNGQKSGHPLKYTMCDNYSWTTECWTFKYFHYLTANLLSDILFCQCLVMERGVCCSSRRSMIQINRFAQCSLCAHPQEWEIQLKPAMCITQPAAPAHIDSHAHEGAMPKYDCAIHFGANRTNTFRQACTNRACRVTHICEPELHLCCLEKKFEKLQHSPLGWTQLHSVVQRTPSWNCLWVSVSVQSEVTDCSDASWNH